jgi:hypothetical protein
MADHDNRHLSRDSLFLLADVRMQGEEASHKVKVRNLSAGGMMAEGPLQTIRGAQVSVHLRNIGWVEGTVAWVQSDRCGIAFHDDIDPMIARAPVAVGEGTPRYVKPPIAFAEHRVRKV